MRRFVLLTIAAILLAGCTLIPPPATPAPPVDKEVEEKAVYVALIQALYPAGSEGQIVIDDQTTPIAASSELTQTLQRVTQQISGIQPETLADIQARNAQAYSLGSLPGLPYKYVLIGAPAGAVLQSARRQV